MPLFTNGIDNASWLTESQMLGAARNAGVVIHAIQLSPPGAETWRSSGRRSPSSPFVDMLAQASGGRRWSATSSRDLHELFTRSINEMRARYLVTFYPEPRPREGWHDLKVTVRGRGEVTTRPGYFVAPRS